MHWSMLNSQYDSANLNEWSSGGCLGTIKTGLGYRFRLAQSTVPASATLGGAAGALFPGDQRRLRQLLQSQEP